MPLGFTAIILQFSFARHTRRYDLRACGALVKRRHKSDSNQAAINTRQSQLQLCCIYHSLGT